VRLPSGCAFRAQISFAVFVDMSLGPAVSYDGLLVQCAGRVIRAAPGKDVAEVHDPATPILATSLGTRLQQGCEQRMSRYGSFSVISSQRHAAMLLGL
jgi:hypothetical protein